MNLLADETMLASSKWIEGMEPDQPISKAVRRALRARLEAVWQYVPLAAKKWEEDVEYVHHLRVAARRARAATRIFADLLSQREARWMKKMLRGLRRAAGAARDLDVLGQRLGNTAEATTGSLQSPLIERIGVCRRKAQKPLVTACEKAKRKGFKKRSRALAKTVSWPSEQPEPTFGDAARTMLAPLVDKFLEAAKADLSDVESLHQMRLAGKRVRYAMELLAGAFDDSFRGELFVAFEEIQERLGTINDHVTAIEMFSGWLERADDDGSPGELAELIAHEEQQLDARRQEFRSWWTAERAEALAQRFAMVLRIPMSSPTDETLRLVM